MQVLLEETRKELPGALGLADSAPFADPVAPSAAAVAAASEAASAEAAGALSVLPSRAEVVSPRGSAPPPPADAAGDVLGGNSVAEAWTRMQANFVPIAVAHSQPAVVRLLLPQLDPATVWPQSRLWNHHEPPLAQWLASAVRMDDGEVLSVLCEYASDIQRRRAHRKEQDQRRRLSFLPLRRALVDAIRARHRDALHALAQLNGFGARVPREAIRAVLKWTNETEAHALALWLLERRYGGAGAAGAGNPWPEGAEPPAASADVAAVEVADTWAPRSEAERVAKPPLRDALRMPCALAALLLSPLARARTRTWALLRASVGGTEAPVGAGSTHTGVATVRRTDTAGPPLPPTAPSNWSQSSPALRSVQGEQAAVEPAAAAAATVPTPVAATAGVGDEREFVEGSTVLLSRVARSGDAAALKRLCGLVPTVLASDDAWGAVVCAAALPPPPGGEEQQAGVLDDLLGV